MNETLRIPVDIEHSGLRGAVLAAFLGAAALFCGLTTVIAPDVGVLIAGGIGLLLGVGAAALTERSLKGRWLSGRELLIDAGGIRLVRRGQIEASFDAGADPEVLRWCFQPRKGRRIPKGWYVVAIALSSDENMIALYSVVSPEKREQLQDRDRFRTLTPPGKTGSAAEDMRLAGEQRRLHEAEVVRWNAGAELTPDSFEVVARQIDTLFG